MEAAGKLAMLRRSCFKLHPELRHQPRSVDEDASPITDVLFLSYSDLPIAAYSKFSHSTEPIESYSDLITNLYGDLLMVSYGSIKVRMAIRLWHRMAVILWVGQPYRTKHFSSPHGGLLMAPRGRIINWI